MTTLPPPVAPADTRSVCFVHTSPAMVHLLTGGDPDAMGGAELQMYMLGRELSRLGWRVSYLVGDYGQTPALRTEEGLMVHAAYEAGQHGALLGTATALRRFWHALEGVDAGVYITRGMTAQTGVVAAFARLRDKRSVFWFGKDADAPYAVPRLSGLPFSERIPAWYGMRNVSAVVCQTTQQLRLLQKYVGRQGKLIRNISPWHDVRRAQGAGGPVLWVGSIQPKKRPEILLDIAAAMPDVEFVLAGGRMRGHEALHDSVVYRTAKLPNVRFAGFVPYAEIAEYFGTAELLLSTSDGAQEGFPNVFLQAWSVGLPVISTCDPDGVIEEHGLGSVQDCTSALVDAIRRFRGDTDLREACGNRARAYVMEHHSPDRVGHQLNHLLTELLGADYSTTEPVGEAVTR